MDVMPGLLAILERLLDISQYLCLAMASSQVLGCGSMI
jgi:hypothetical protein